MKRLFILLLLTSGLVADDLDILLDEFAQKSDLSVKTKKEDSGELLLYTRLDLDKMQVRTLKDIIKHIPTFGYSENRQGNPSLITTNIPYTSTNQLRMYIDNQEIAIGALGTSYGVFGNIDLDFVDHVEIYLITPSYSSSIEPNNLLIKLYSKKAERDKGGLASIRYGSRDINQQTLSYGQKLDKFNYYAYASHINENSMPKNNFGTTLKKDKEDIHVFANLQTQSDRIQINYLNREQDPYASISPSATPLEANTDIEYFHIGYEKDILKDLVLQVTYDKTDYSLSHLDAVTLAPTLAPLLVKQFNNTIEDELVSAKLQYQLNIANHEIITGIKHKYNTFSNNEVYDFVGLNFPNKTFDTQQITTLFVEDSYDISSEHNIIAGLKYAVIDNNGEISDDKFVSYRAGYLYETDSLLSKIFYNHDTLPLSNYLYTSNTYTPSNPNSLEAQEIDSLIYSIQNKDKIFFTKLFLSYLKIKNYPSLDPTTGKFSSFKKDIDTYAVGVDFRYKIDKNHSIKTSPSYGKIGANNGSGVSEYISGYINLFSKFEEVNIFNEIYFYDKLSDNRDFSAEYSLGVSYRHNDALEFSLKGDNLFYSGSTYTDGIIVLNPTNGYQAEPLKHQTNDRLILAQVKYFF